MENKACPACKEMGHDSQDDHLFLMADKKRWYCGKSEKHKDGKPYIEGDGIKHGEEEEGQEAYAGANQLDALLMPDTHTDEPEDEADESTDNGMAFFKAVNAEPVGVPKPRDSSVLSFGPVSPSTIPIAAPSNATRTIDAEYRGILPITFAKYGVTGVYNSSGKCTEHRHDLLEVGTDRVVTQKIRVLPKTFTCAGKTGKGTLIQLFGQSVFKRAKRILVVEGEFDAMSAYQMLSKWRVAVVSLPLGGNKKAIADNLKYFKGFKEVTFCLDQDDVGKGVSRDITNIMPHARFMEISEKDANDMLTKGKQAEFVSAFFDAEIFKPDTIVRVADVMDRIMQKPVMGEPWPWPTLTAKTYGRNPGQGIYVGAGVKIGKSEFINEVVKFDVQRGKKVGILKYEEPPFMTVKRVAGKIDGTFYHKPDVNYSDVALKATALSMQDLLIMYPAFGSATWDSTKSFIRYAAMMGCETIIIDPITKLTNTLNSSETETELRKLSDELACMAQDMGFFYIVTCHLKTPYSGPPHERGGKVQSSQFRGSRAMMENTYYMMGIERDKDPTLTLVEQNTSTFVLLEDRNFGNSASFPVVYNPVDQSYLEPTGGIF